MDSLKQNISRILILTLLLIYGLEVASEHLMDPLLEKAGLSEIPFDAEGEKEKTKNEKEWDDEILLSHHPKRFYSLRLSLPFNSSSYLSHTPLEIVTPPPELI